MSSYILTNSEGSGQPATRYLTGFTGSDSTLIMPDFVPSPSIACLPERRGEGKGDVGAGVGYLLLDGRYWESGAQEISNIKYQTPNRSHISLVRVHRDYTVKQAIQDIITRHAMTTVTVDSRLTTYATVLTLQGYGLTVEPRDGLMQQIREYKSASEMQAIGRAQEVALAAYERLLPEVRVGVSERSLAARLEYYMREGGADAAAFPTIVASGPHSALPHATVTDRVITSEDAIIIDFGARVEGYCSDYTRTILMPDAPARLREIYTIVERAQRAALDFVTLSPPGVAGVYPEHCRGGRSLTKGDKSVTCSDIDRAARSVIEEAGYGEYFTHAVGHGVGMEVHELPHVSYRSTATLQPGHVITIEPGIYIPALGGVRLEEMVMVR